MIDLLAAVSRIERAIPGMARAIPDLAYFIDSYRERRQLKRVAKDLALLAFWDDDGVLAPLQRIAAGKGSREDIDELAERMQETKNSATKAARNIIRARENLTTALGMEVAQTLYSVVNGKVLPAHLGDHGRQRIVVLPCPIRVRIQEFVKNKELDVPEATAIVEEIQKFNRDISNVHEMVRPKSSHIAIAKVNVRKNKVANMIRSKTKRNSNAKASRIQSG